MSYIGHSNMVFWRELDVLVFFFFFFVFFFTFQCTPQFGIKIKKNIDFTLQWLAANLHLELKADCSTR